MYANGAFKNPFADFDFSKFAGEFKFPMINVETIVETGRKNFAAMTTATTAAVESIKTIAQRQGDMVRAAMEDFSKHGSDVLGAATIEEKAAKQIDFAKKSYDAAIANTKELTDLYTKGHTEAFETLSAPRRRADRRGQGRDRARSKTERRSAPNGQRGCLQGQPLFLSTLQASWIQITYDDFEQGRHPRRHDPSPPQPLEGARKPALRLEIDFGPEIGVKKSSAQLTVHYTPEQPGRPAGRGGGQLPAAPDRQVHVEVLTLGFPDADGAVVLVVPDKAVPNGGKLF